jgi:hypothetical protein
MKYKVIFGKETLGTITLSNNNKFVIKGNSEQNSSRIKNFIQHTIKENESPEKFLHLAPIRFNGYVRVIHAGS